MSQYLKTLSRIAAVTALLLAAPGAGAFTTYSLANMPNPNNLAAKVTPNQTADNIQPSNQSDVLHLFREGEGWSNGSQESAQATCNWDLGTGCAFNAARNCQIASGIDTCNFDLLVNGTYTLIDPDTGQQTCNSQLQNLGQTSSSTTTSCSHNVQQVTVNWGDGTTTTATYEHHPSSNPENPQNVPEYMATHSYSSLPSGAAGTYPITVTENVGGTWVNTTTYTYQDVVTWNLAYPGSPGFPGNAYDWSGTGQMIVSTPATQHNAAYGAAVNFNPASGFSGAANIGGSVMVGFSGPGNSGIYGSGFSLYPDNQPTGGPSQQGATGSAINLSSTTAQFSGGPINVGDAWGWFVFTVANANTVDITYNGTPVGTISSYLQSIPHTTAKLTGGAQYIQNLSVYVYRNTPPPVQGGQEIASPTPATAAEE